ncbi:MAG: M48 family metallopeptidase, partial [Brevinematales bacterium]
LFGIGMFGFWFFGLPFLIDRSVDYFLQGKILETRKIREKREFGASFSLKINEKASGELQKFVLRYLSCEFPSVFVVQAPFENAFATLWGDIVVSENMIHALHNPDELAALLYHEGGHLHYHHPLKVFLRRNIGVFLLLLFTGGSDIPQLVLRTGEEMMVLQYNRDFEILADEYALGKLVETGFEPQAMENLLLSLSKRNKEDFWLFSTHPSFEKRIALLREKRKRMKFHRTGVSSREREKDFLSLKQKI